MRVRTIAFAGLLASGGLAGALISGYGVTAQAGNAARRATNAEIRLISQSCFQGEIEACG